MLRTHRLELAVAAIFLVLLALLCHQQSPGRPLDRTETERYLSAIDRQVAMPADEKAEALTRLRAWSAADDGQPVYMLNVMRMFDQVKPIPGAPPFTGTPAQANAYYESKAMPLLFALGAWPQFAGDTQGRNLFGYGDGRDAWSRVLVVRYPSRRAFLQLVADPAYAPLAPYKLMSLDLLLVPTTFDTAIPDPRLLLGVVGLVTVLALGWWRAARSRRA